MVNATEEKKYSGVDYIMETSHDITLVACGYGEPPFFRVTFLYFLNDLQYGHKVWKHNVLYCSVISINYLLYIIYLSVFQDLMVIRYFKTRKTVLERN